ncbi:hypothetical protein LSTR_LSTR012045 [Laodelphax striatellus]|uniref:Uncharacterized protein n=1 Tax=Laodelphax striatellus TaxID=195883 RepID=A0A482WQ90_LAOST|nr:hypothetical protein LSTR_LSTR012045 [Laodelphax striatellus]
MASSHIFLLGCVIFLQCSATFSASLDNLPIWPAKDKLVNEDSAKVNNITKECGNTVHAEKEGKKDGEKVEKSDAEYACVNLCNELYSCTSLEMGLFELHFKGDKCLNYCGKKLVCNEIQKANSTGDESDIDDKFGITVREFSCAENQRLDRNGICRNYKKS